MLQTGEEIGRYRVEGLIGQGGLAKVYRVRHTTLGTTMALKVLVVRGSAIGRRLIREGRIQARLAHPNVVNVTDVIEHDGRAGLLMEYVEGVGLDAYLQRTGALPLGEALGIFDQIMAGMIAAHDAQILHRDLKPANILLAASSGGTLAKVTDFGIAKVLQGGDDGQHTQGDTLQGDLIGTPGYMPPEQVADPTSIDERADVYGLGAVLYCMVTGRPPFLPGSGLAETLHQAETGQFPPVLELRPECPPTVAAAIEACLSPAPSGRPASVRALARRVRGADHSVLLAVPEARATPLGTPLANETLAPLSQAGTDTAGRPPADPTAVPSLDSSPQEHTRAGPTTAVPAQLSLAPKHPVAPPAPGADAPPVAPSPSDAAGTFPRPGGGRSRGRWLIGLAVLIGVVALVALRPGAVEPQEPPSSIRTAVTPTPGAGASQAARSPLPDTDPVVPSDGAPAPQGSPPDLDPAAPATDAADAPAGTPPAAPPVPPATDAEPPVEAPSSAAAPASGSPPTEPAPGPTPPVPQAAGDATPADGKTDGPPAADTTPTDSPPDAPPTADASPAGEPATPSAADDATADAGAPPTGGSDDSEDTPAPETRPPVASVMGTWLGRWSGRPITMRILQQSGGAVSGSLEVQQGQGIRTIQVAGRMGEDGALTLAEKGGGWTIQGKVEGGAFQGTIQAPQMRKPARLSAQRQ